MHQPRISASSYSNTAPLVWSFLYGKNHGKAELIMDTAPARSAELLMQDRVDAALVPVIAYQMIEGVRLVPDVCVGARERVRSVCLVTKGSDLADVRSVSLDTSSRTSVALTKIIFREFLGFEPVWKVARPDIEEMLADSDAALLIGDPALRLSADSRLQTPNSGLKYYDLAELWKHHTGFGFVFAMWMTRRDSVEIDFASARNEGIAHIDEIIANYETDIHLGRDEMRKYLSENISYSIDDPMRSGMELYFKLAEKHGLISKANGLQFVK
ncbi:MAG TPA: menaquinone biosynthesis protein [Pyrinomonadaceae bacterium]|nr:menaquinone biosynthesis protein [Acidobacteriota bacterium]HQZ95753.1 menaquinone biosynthesis protein [Pyrinomonadaceae bacterium]